MSDDFERHCWVDVIPPEDLETYAAYRRPRALGERPALLLIDVYNAVFGDRREPLAQSRRRFPSSCGPAAWDALEPLQQLLARARVVQVPVFYTTGETRPEAIPDRFTVTKRAVSETPYDEVWNYTIVEPLAPRPGEVVIYKQRASGFFGTPLEAHLRMLGVDTLVVAGETTSGCVRASVVDAYSHGFKIAVVEQATFDRAQTTHKVNLFDMHHKYADVVHLDEALDFLDQMGSRTGATAQPAGAR